MRIQDEATEMTTKSEANTSAVVRADCAARFVAAIRFEQVGF
jgi:hypothetical protein